uniref:Uncharacterized protein n=1 Tax=Romanomermis culicivorax TaxID=13658 RepID=A0A915HJX1_ROMCU
MDRAELHKNYIGNNAHQKLQLIMYSFISKKGKRKKGKCEEDVITFSIARLESPKLNSVIWEFASLGIAQLEINLLSLESLSWESLN